MNRLTSLFIFIAMFLACAAKEITIIPQFEQGEILKYRTMSQFRSYEGKDTIISTTKLLPEIMVEQFNDNGVILRTSNRHESSTFEERNPREQGSVYVPDGDLNVLVATRTLWIQLNRDFRPDSVLNLNDVRKEMPNDYIRWITDSQEDINEISTEQKMIPDPLDEAYVNSICAPRYLIEQHFSNIPYFNFYGIPLESGKIPASMVLTQDIMGMCSEISELEIEIRQYEKANLTFHFGPNFSKRMARKCLEVSEKKINFAVGLQL